MSDLPSILARKGIIQDPSGDWTRDPGYSGSELVTDEALRWLNECFVRRNRRGQNDYNSQLKLHWVQDFCKLIIALDADEKVPWPFISMFWVRLHGIVDELRVEVEANRRFFSDNGLDHGVAFDVVIRMHDSIERIISTFTEDELIYADYRRLREAHVTQSSYDVRWSKKKVLDRRGVSALDRKEYSVDELDAAIARVARTYPNDQAIAVAFARRLRLPTVSLLESASAFYEPQYVSDGD